MAGKFMNYGIAYALDSLIDVMLDTVDTNVRLFQNDYTPLYTSVFADFMEADFDGYAPVTDMAMASATFVANGEYESESNVPYVYIRDIGVNSNDIYGYYVTWFDGVDEIVLLAERFSDAPLNFTVPLTELDLTVLITYIDANP